MRRAAGAGAAAVAALVIAGCGGGVGGGSTGDTTTGTRTSAAAATGARTYRDPFGDVTPGQPDLTAVRIANDAHTIRLAFRFANAPPLGSNARQGWTDMLLMGIDVPPIGSPPTPNGWTGLDYALGMHGVAPEAVFRDMHVEGRQMTVLPSRISRGSIVIDLDRSRIGDPPYFDFNVAVAREGASEPATGDSIPTTGTLRYRLSP